jgi:hypothetical protein
MGGITWPHKAYEDMTFSEALVELGRLTQALGQVEGVTTETKDSEPLPDYAQEFADACRKFHRSSIAQSDCRPQLRIAAAERREVLDAGEDAAGYAAAMRALHRK